MKIAGQVVPKELNTDVLVLPRGDAAIAIKAQAIVDYEEFEKLCPMPEAPGKLTKDGFVPDIEDETYKQKSERHSLQRVGWMVINSLVDVEWDSVDINNPKTWTKWEEDMTEAGFSSVERNLILGLVLSVNALDEQKLKDARESFIRGQVRVADESDSQTSERKSSRSGAPASGSE